MRLGPNCRADHTLGLWVTLLCLAACNTHHGGDSGERADGGPDDHSVSPIEGDAGVLDPCVRACKRYEQACMSHELCSVLCEQYRGSFVGCETEFDATYECYAMEPNPTFDCASDGFVWHDSEACRDLKVTLHYCDRTEGAPCKTEPVFDESCTAGHVHTGTRFLFCKEDVEPPQGCESYLQQDQPLGYCCPEDSVAEFD